MKKLEQLGISPAPWQCQDIYWVKDARGMRSLTATDATRTRRKSIADARLIAAAPDLYEALRKLVFACGERGYKDGGTAPCYESEHKLYRAIWEAEATLAKAGGAE